MAEAEAKEAERIASDVFKRGTLFVQIKLLLWKNLKLKSREKWNSGLEFILPFLVGALLIWVRSQKVFDPVPVPRDNESSLTDLFPLRCNQTSSIYPIVIVPNNARTQDLASKINEYCSYNASLMNSEEELIDKVQSPDFVEDSIKAAIIFKNYSPNWKYELRMNASEEFINGVPDTEQIEVEFTTNFQSLTFFDEYLGSQFPMIQAVVDEWIMMKELNLNDGFVSLFSLYVNKFPSPAYSTEDFWALMENMAVLLILITFLWSFTRLVKSVLDEKSNKIREGMRMMGMNDSAFWLSWYFFYFGVFTILSIIFSALLKVNIYSRTNYGFIFLYFWIFSFSLISFGLLVSVLLKSPRSAILLAIVAFLAGYVLYQIFGGDDRPASTTTALCLFSPSCFGVIVRIVGALEQAQTGVTFSSASRVVYNMSYNRAILLMLLDGLLYLFFTWYFDKVLPSEFGVRKKWYFLFQKEFWLSGRRRNIDDKGNYFELKSNPQMGDFFENVSNSENRRGIVIRGLSKRFPPSSGSDPVVAVDNLMMDMFEGEVFALLGHNGAGKTTTISMLTGLTDVTDGDASLFGLSIANQMDNVHSIIGVCPQQNVLFDTLTVKEHLYLFAELKGVPKNEIDSRIQKAIEDVGLTEKTNSQSKTLSGGQKRKLCVAIAFIGDPKVVFLDEPTSGMDVSSRRATWDIIKQNKKDKVIVLTTHFLEEADLLGDRVGIMAKGKLVCCGTPLFLKSKYGVGYTITLTKSSAQIDSSPILDKIAKNVATFQLLQDVGTELMIRIPVKESPNFPELFREFDNRRSDLQIVNYGVSVTTLEEVFINVGHDHDSREKELIGEYSQKKEIVSPDEVPVDNIQSLMKKSRRDDQTTNSFSVWLRHFGALFVKRWHFIKRDKGSVVCLSLMPVIMMLLAIAAINSAIRFASKPLTLSVEQFHTPVPLPIIANEDDSTFSDQAFRELFNGDLVNPYLFSQNVRSVSLNDFIELEKDRDKVADEFFQQAKNFKKATFGAFMDLTQVNQKPNMVIYVNQTAVHGMPTYINLLTNALLHKLTGNKDLSITTVNHPFPLTEFQLKIAETSQAIFTVIYLTQAVAFVPAAFISFIVSERVTKAKHQQLISGVSISAYWISNFIFDAVVSIMPITLVVILLSVAGTETWKGTNLAVAVLALFLYSLASIPQVYLFSYAFKSPLSSKVVTFVVAYLTGSILSLVSFILNFAGGTTEKVNTALTPVYRFFPGYNLGEVLLNLTINNFRKVSVWSEDMARDGIVTLSWEIFVYLACLIIIEYLISVPKIMAFIKSSLRMERDVPMDAFVEDDDVMSEKQRVKSSNDENSIIEVLGLRKVFKGFPSKKVAVKDLWFSIPRGECFGFLGINGAGKTTTLEILSGDLFPTRGTARLGGFDILSEQLKVRRLIGYCPQFDALIGNLTAREHLYMFARIKNVPEEEIRDIVNGMIKYLSLEEYANRPASTYSGGNKRKLSVAIALIGDPLIVFLDEPSTGVDPVARRFMWKFISDTMSGRSVILTTHSMDECEALCHRIGIMVGGRLRCLGSAQHLKNKFGSGYQFDVTVPVDFAEEFISQIRGLIKDIRLIERHEGAMKFQIPPTALSLADIFEIIEKNKQLLQINDYSVSQTTLEQIFIHFAKQQDEEKGVAKGFQGVDGLAPLGLSEGETHKELKIGECPQSEEVTTEPKV